MYKIIKNGKQISLVGKPTWIRKQENGSFGLTDEANAQGVVVNGEVYHIVGQPEIEGKETVAVCEVDDGKYASIKDAQIAVQAEQLTYLEDCLLELGDVVYA